MTTNQQRARNAGSNFTVFRYAGKNIAYLTEVQDQGQEPVTQPVSVHPLGKRHPSEIVTPRAINSGAMTLSIVERWHENVWEQMAGLAGTNDIVEVFARLAARGRAVNCAKIIKPPTGPRYGKTYHGCVITDIQDGETYNIRTLSQTKRLTIAYTHTTAL